MCTIATTTTVCSRHLARPTYSRSSYNRVTVWHGPCTVTSRHLPPPTYSTLRAGPAKNPANFGQLIPASQASPAPESGKRPGTTLRDTSPAIENFLLKNPKFPPSAALKICSELERTDSRWSGNIILNTICESHELVHLDHMRPRSFNIANDAGGAEQ